MRGILLHVHATSSSIYFKVKLFSHQNEVAYGESPYFSKFEAISALFVLLDRCIDGYMEKKDF